MTNKEAITHIEFILNEVIDPKSNVVSFSTIFIEELLRTALQALKEVTKDDVPKE